MADKKDKKQITKNKKVSEKKYEKMKDKPGGSNVGEYKDLPASDFAGSVPGTFPIPNKEKAKSALKLAHNDKNPESVKRKVYKKYPSLKKK